MHNSSGTVLLMVLILSAMMYLIAGALLLLTMTETHIADFEQRSTQAFYLAESGVTVGLAKLREKPNYRTDMSDAIISGANPGTFTVRFYDGNKKHPYFRKSLEPAWYHLVLRGTGSVPGLNAIAQRMVERDVFIKPFVLFAQNGINVTGGCAITGNIHGNGPVTLAAGNTVTGDVTSAIQVNDAGIIKETDKSSVEPPLTFPASPLAAYYPTYQYQGATYEAQPLTHDTLKLAAVNGIEPPAPAIEIYSGFPTTENPAGVFYPADSMTGALVALQVTGTVIIPPAQSLDSNGSVRITPVDNFPALISANDLNLTLVGNLEVFAKSLEKSRIQGVIYAAGDIAITGNDTTGDVLIGGILGREITLTGNPVLQVKYAPAIFANPPPGLDFIELGEWREIFE